MCLIPLSCSSFTCDIAHSIPTCLVQSALLWHDDKAETSSLGRSTLNVFGITVSWLMLTIGLIPGIIGTFIPAARHDSTKEKYFRLSKNICVTIYDAPLSTLCFSQCISVSALGDSSCFSGYPATPYVNLASACVSMFVPSRSTPSLNALTCC